MRIWIVEIWIKMPWIMVISRIVVSISIILVVRVIMPWVMIRRTIWSSLLLRFEHILVMVVIAMFMRVLELSLNQCVGLVVFLVNLHRLD